MRIDGKVCHFHNPIIAQRSSDASGLIYLHSDHLGSVSLVTNQNQAVVSRQEFDPWGAIRSGGISQTTLNYNWAAAGWHGPALLPRALL
ncbi:hypothetical protein [Kallotenue papyrolyticum]|uniref:hypothetical protein n=1 Tax=Kallotenue papyrolyticum TaxID=1325125 RepID=UPI00047855B7|nr:hypothetical protein [Kallotenue papyrolyticum]